MFKLEIDTSNDAFVGSAETERGEIARILRDAADRMEAGRFTRSLYDMNGNRVGRLDWERKPG